MKWKWRIVFAVVVAAIVAANHVEHYLRAERQGQAGRQAQERDVPVVQAVDNALGHSSIRIDEQAHRSGYLYFDTLESWAFSKSNPGGCPQSVKQADGKKVKITGFMYPLQDAANFKVFCLLRSTQTCCYGPRPQYNQYVFVEMPEPAKFERLAPVVVEGKFVIDPRPDDGYIYRMEGQSIRPAVPNDQPASAAEFARQNNLPIFDFAPLEAVKIATDPSHIGNSAAIAKLAADLDGKQMVVGGFIVGRIKDAPPKIMIGKYAWDGKAKGTHPGLYNAVLVTPTSASDVPPVWWQEAVFKGTIHVTKDPAERAKNGVVSLADAVLAVAPASDQDLSTNAGPLLPLPYECVAVFLCGGLFLVGLFNKRQE
jgi:hypothetical protein